MRKSITGVYSATSHHHLVEKVPGYLCAATKSAASASRRARTGAERHGAEVQADSGTLAGAAGNADTVLLELKRIAEV
ncbi:hypothetical protein [Tunturiibacter lichenicola]|uniref:hypothetical protein n=1 Tax=Tunturiibacter lichenicola TaxID=2051959 RepID=UPI003D9B6A96